MLYTYLVCKLADEHILQHIDGSIRMADIFESNSGICTCAFF